MTPLLENLISSCFNSKGFFFKFIAANDVGATGSHQAGFYMPRDTWPLFFDSPGKNEENRDVWVRLHWPNGHLSQARYVWYGVSKKEYRLTRGFSYLGSDNVGDLLVLVKQDAINFFAFLLNTEEDIEDFYSFFGISPGSSCRLQTPDEDEKSDFDEFIREWLNEKSLEFPSSENISTFARELYKNISSEERFDQVDELLTGWIETEYLVFRRIENLRYKKYINQPINSVSELIRIGNTIMNRRKARAGFSLENHLRYIFEQINLPFSHQETTEGKKRPDFLFPGIDAYRDKSFPKSKLIFLAVKTTCKDRWRQILNEADRIETKYLFTLQRGISENQMTEMETCSVRLVVPEKYKKDFPANYRGRILSLSEFIRMAKENHQTES